MGRQGNRPFSADHTQIFSLLKKQQVIRELERGLFLAQKNFLKTDIILKIQVILRGYSPMSKFK